MDSRCSAESIGRKTIAMMEISVFSVSFGVVALTAICAAARYRKQEARIRLNTRQSDVSRSVEPDELRQAAQYFGPSPRDSSVLSRWLIADQIDLSLLAAEKALDRRSRRSDFPY